MFLFWQAYIATWPLHCQYHGCCFTCLAWWHKEPGHQYSWKRHCVDLVIPESSGLTSQHYFFYLSVQGTGSILKVSSCSSLDWYKKKTLWSLSAVDKPKSMGRPPDHPCWKTGLPESFLGCPNYFDLSLRQNLNVFYWIIFPLIESWVAHRDT